MHSNGISLPQSAFSFAERVLSTFHILAVFPLYFFTQTTHLFVALHLQIPSSQSIHIFNICSPSTPRNSIEWKIWLLEKFPYKLKL